MMLLVHPVDPTIKRLERLLKYVICHTDSSESLLIKPGDIYKKKALNELEKRSKEDFIVFLGHGRSDALFGSKGAEWTAVVSPEAIEQDPDKFYNDENLISSTNYQLLKGKKIFCFACNSVELGQTLEKSGIDCVLLGFDRLPTTKEEFKEDWHLSVSRHMLAATKGCLDIAVRQCIITAVEQHCEFGEMEDIMKFELQKQISFLLASKARYRYELANVLSAIKGNVMVVGDRSVRV